MKRPRHTRSSLFLIELIISILFFSVGSAVCIQAFAQARLMSQAAEDLSFASARVSGAASVIRYTDGSLESVQRYLPSARQTDGGYQICYDRNQQPCEEENAAYILSIHTEQTGNRTDAHLVMTDRDRETIFELSLRYPAPTRPDQGGSADESE